MYHFLNRIYLEPLENIGSHIHRIVVGRYVDEAFIDYHEDNIGKAIVGQSFPATLYYTNNPDHFINEVFPDLLPKLGQLDEPVRLYVDDQTRVRLLTYWWKAIFPHITKAQLKHLLAISLLDRTSSDLMARFDDRYYQDKFIDKIFNPTQPDPKVVAYIRDHWDQVSLEYRIIPALKGYGTSGVATTLRKFALESLDWIVGNVQQSMLRLFYGDKMANLTGAGSEVSPLGHHPFTRMENMEILHTLPQLSQSRELQEDPRGVLEAISRDMSHLDGSSIPLDVEYFSTMLTGSDDQVVQQYLKQLQQEVCLYNVMPAKMFNRLSCNMMTYLHRSYRHNTALVTCIED